MRRRGPSDAASLEERVREAMQRRAPRAVHPMELVHVLRMGRDGRALVEEALERMRARGEARMLPGGRYRLTDGRGRRAWPTLRGVLTRHPRGFGFVTADDGGPDVFVPPTAMGAALHGDRVEVELRTRGPRREGIVRAVLERRGRALAGVVRRARGGFWVQPCDPRQPEAMAVVGDLPEGIDEGELVRAEIATDEAAVGFVPPVRVVEAIGRAGELGAELRALLVDAGVEEAFAPEVLAEAEALPDHVTQADRAGREDLTHVDFVTIDPVDARDHDDAVWAERLDDGSFHVRVAVADVAHYVRPGSALDAEAARRGCSVYLPDRVLPMLPRALSAAMASLLPGEDRLALVVDVVVDARGRPRRPRFYEAVIRSRARLTYEQVACVLEPREGLGHAGEAEAWHERLLALRAVSDVLVAARRRRGALELDLPEAKVVLGPDGEPVDVLRARAEPSVRRAYGVIEDLMVLANELVAAELERRAVPFVYRVHDEPDPARLEGFAQLARALGLLSARADPADPLRLQAIVRRASGKPAAETLAYLLLRSLPQAVYAVDNRGHYGLASRCYTHFTSPIRRYPDLCVHRALKNVLGGRTSRSESAREALRAVAAAATRAERRAMELERAVVDLYRARRMQAYLGRRIEGFVGGVGPYGITVTLEAPFVEVRVPMGTLGHGAEPDEWGIALVWPGTGQRLSLGERVLVRIDAVDLTRREVVGTLVRPRAIADGPHPPSRGRRWRATTAAGHGGDAKRARAHRRQTRRGAADRR
ncbi:MAG: VacB/RNase II family 3'-5' exoribonuclease [Myxococcota bacterium]|nr:VacB/RNase II family 3'-5' exoribonuclease [Myxococcota bacterium]MDW8363271.1 VacB/RNase II family 3'-5' exoribonuclease [Myxococcales bacterium]